MNFATVAILAFAAAIPSVGSAQPTIYEPVLTRIAMEYGGERTILFDAPLHEECLLGGCPEPWAERFPASWLESVKERRLIAEACTYDQGLCRDGAGENVWVPGALYLTLSTPRPCEGNCAEIIVSFLLESGPHSLIRRYLSFRLTERDGRWVLCSVAHLGDSYVHG